MYLVSSGSFDKLALVQLMDWHCIGDMFLSEPMVTQITDVYKCVKRISLIVLGTLVLAWFYHNPSMHS